MKLVALILTYIFFINAFAAAPLGVSGQSQSNLYPAVVKVPNNQATNTGAATSLLETGNKNILSNPSFEHATVTTGWTLAAGTSTGDTVNEIDGLKALSISLSSQTLALTQDSTLYASQFNGVVQGLATVRVKTAVAGVRLCARQAGVTSSTLCVSHSGSGNWELLKIPFILSATSNGLSINTASNVTGTVLVDDAFVGPVDLKIDTNNISNTVSYTPVVTTNTGTMTNYTATGSYRRVGEYIEGSVNITFNGAPGTWSAPFVSIPSGLIIDTSKITNFAMAGQVSARSTAEFPIGVAYAASSTTIGITASTVSGSQVIEAAMTQAVPFAFVSGNSIKLNYRLPIVGWASSGSIYTQPYYGADRIGEVIFSSNSTAPSGFISALGSSIGQSGSGATFTGDAYYALYEHLWSLAGLSTTAGDPYRISSAKGASASADWSAGKTITVDYATNELFIRAKGSARTLGSYQDSDNKSHSHSFTTYRAHTTIDNFLVGRGAATPAQDVSTSASGGSESRPKNVALFAYVRFQADNQIIVGQFNGLESCADTYQCTDTYSAYIDSSGTVSQENVEWITGNSSITDTSLFSLTFKTGLFTVNPNCQVTPVENSTTIGVETKIASGSTSAYTVRTGFTNTTSSFTKAPYSFFILCQKQGVDYIGKTAKAVASDQNVRSVGSVGVDIQSVYFGSGANCDTVCSTSPCTICYQVGTKITSVTRTGVGSYNVNGIDGTKYNCHGTAIAQTAGYMTIIHSKSGSTSSMAAISSAAATNVADSKNASLTCIGIP